MKRREYMKRYLAGMSEEERKSMRDYGAKWQRDRRAGLSSEELEAVRAKDREYRKNRRDSRSPEESRAEYDRKRAAIAARPPEEVDLLKRKCSLEAMRYKARKTGNAEREKSLDEELATVRKALSDLVSKRHC